MNKFYRSTQEFISSSVPEEPTGETDCSTYVLSQDNK